MEFLVTSTRLFYPPRFITLPTRRETTMGSTGEYSFIFPSTEGCYGDTTDKGQGGEGNGICGSNDCKIEETCTRRREHRVLGVPGKSTQKDKVREASWIDSHCNRFPISPKTKVMLIGVEMRAEDV